MMWYEKELMGPRPSGASRGLQIFQTPQKQKFFQWQKYRSKLEENFNYSTIHGMRYVFEMGQHRWQRYFWLLVTSIAIIYCMVTHSDLARRHREQQLITVVQDTQYPIYKIDFPAVAVCPYNKINWSRAKAAAERFLPGNKDPNLEDVFHKLLIFLETQRIGNFDKFGDLALFNIKGISNISLMELASYMAFRCYELFMPLSCIFDETTYNCCRLFVQEFTAGGYCLVFNSMVTIESRKKKFGNRYYPMKISRAGEMSGLMFTIQSNSKYLRPESKIPFAMHLMIKKSIQWSEMNIYKLHSNTESSITIKPLLSDYSNNAYHLPPSKRQCYFEHDNNSYFAASNLEYDHKNCLGLCVQHQIVGICNCTLSGFFPPISGQRDCQVADLDCIYKNQDVFNYVKVPHQDQYIRDNRRGVTCKCERNCNFLNFLLTLNVKTLKSNHSPNMSAVIKVDIHFAKRTMIKLYTKLEYTYLDAFAKFGGILGLFLGASFLSLCEVMFPFSKLLWLFIIDIRNILKHKFNKNRRVLQVTNKNTTSGQKVFVIQSRDIHNSWTKTFYSSREH